MHTERMELELASNCFRECLRIRTMVLTEDHIDIGHTLYHLARSIIANTSNDKTSAKQAAKTGSTVSNQMEATQFFIDAIRIYKIHVGPDHVAIGKCLASLGGIFEDNNDIVKAESCYTRAISIFDASLTFTDSNSSNAEDEEKSQQHQQTQLPPTLEEITNLNQEDDYYAFAGALLDYATFLDRRSDDNDGDNDNGAMKTYHRALKLYKTLLGPKDDMLVSILCNIANLLGRQRRYDEAQVILEQALKMRKENLGIYHPAVADVLFGLGILYDKKRNYDEAIKSFESCLKIRRGYFQRNTIEEGLADELGIALTLTHIGMVKGNRADFSGALESWDEALSIYKQKLGLPDEDPAVAEVVKHQAIAKRMLESIGVADGGGNNSEEEDSADDDDSEDE